MLLLTRTTVVEHDNDLESKLLDPPPGRPVFLPPHPTDLSPLAIRRPMCRIKYDVRKWCNAQRIVNHGNAVQPVFVVR